MDAAAPGGAVVSPALEKPLGASSANTLSIHDTPTMRRLWEYYEKTMRDSHDDDDDGAAFRNEPARIQLRMHMKRSSYTQNQQNVNKLDFKRSLEHEFSATPLAQQ